MTLQFDKVIIYNFGSYLSTEINLADKGFCLVSGKNNFKKDNALSNGAGKSMIWSAICFALTGETISGISTNLKNINSSEADCYVTVNFSIDNIEYSITRYHKPKSDLKILKNNIDISGKGIRESEKILSENIPDLSKDLIASIIILGQGMPNKFSSFTPSGRKDLLEKLTKSEFMIDDIKTRLTTRLKLINDKIRSYEDIILVTNTKLDAINLQLSSAKRELVDIKKPNFDVDISYLTEQLQNITEKVNTTNKSIAENEADLDNFNLNLVAINKEKATVCATELEQFNKATTELISKKSQLTAEITMLNKEILHLNNVIDICPTCHQKLPGIIKPDTTVQVNALNQAQIALSEIESKLIDYTKKHNSYIDQINKAFDADINNITIAIKNTKAMLVINKASVTSTELERTSMQTKLNKLIYDKENFDNYYLNLTTSVTELESQLQSLTEIITDTTTKKVNLEEHLAVLKKIDTLIKRDFRGYLLSNIINYINTKAKEYCKVVFGTCDLDFYLDGNNINIKYCGKMLDSLSGGEQTRVDLILQLALRSMLQTYLNFNTNIIILDEVTDFLDKQSCSYVMKLLETELNTIESVFIVSHHSDELDLHIDSEIMVIKNEDGISEIL